MLEAIKDPLIHMIRNAVDHGVETPAERVAAGKPAQGRITAAVRLLERGRLELELADDGRGIDADARPGRGPARADRRPTRAD